MTRAERIAIICREFGSMRKMRMIFGNQDRVIATGRTNRESTRDMFERIGIPLQLVGFDELDVPTETDDRDNETAPANDIAEMAHRQAASLVGASVLVDIRIERGLELVRTRVERPGRPPLAIIEGVTVGRYGWQCPREVIAADVEHHRQLIRRAA